MDGGLKQLARASNCQLPRFYKEKEYWITYFVYKRNIKNMKRILNITLMLAFVMLATVNASAQAKMTEEQIKEVKARYQANKEKLNLTADQSKKVDAINTTWFEGVASIKNSGGSKMERYKKFKSLNQERDSKMKEVLTKEQFKIYKQQKQEMKEEFKQRRANRE